MTERPENVHILFPERRTEIEAFIKRQKRRRFAADSFIYFIQAGPRRPVKIGISNDPWKRIGRLQTGAPDTYQMLAIMPGGKDEEMELHARFAPDRIRGEWFHKSRELAGFIKEVAGEHWDLLTRCDDLARARAMEERKYAEQFKKGLVK